VIIYMSLGRWDQQMRTTKRKIQQNQTEKTNYKRLRVWRRTNIYSYKYRDKITTVIIGASNCRRIKVTDPNICNLSISGTTAENIDAILENVDCKLNTTGISKIIFS
jgi:hypothetical protein